jgi:hypothetical protein
MTNQVCSVCNIEKPLELFSKAKHKKSGYACRCSSCDAARTAAYRAANPDKVKRSNQLSKQKNADKVKEMKRLYRLNNAEKVKLARKISLEKHKERDYARAAQFRLENKERLALKRKEFHAAHPYVATYKAAQRRGRIHKATPSWANKTYIAGYYRTAHDLSMYTGDWYQVDHIVPLTSDVVCGLHCESNLQVISRSENLSKSNRYWPDKP